MEDNTWLTNAEVAVILHRRKQDDEQHDNPCARARVAAAAAAATRSPALSLSLARGFREGAALTSSAALTASATRARAAPAASATALDRARSLLEKTYAWVKRAVDNDFAKAQREVTEMRTCVCLSRRGRFARSRAKHRAAPSRLAHAPRAARPSPFPRPAR